MEALIIISQIIGGGLSRRIAGGLGNEWVRVKLGKPDGWEIPNGIIRGICALYFTLLLPISWHSILLFGLIFLGVSVGYLKQVGEYFGFKSGFNLEDKELRNWKNYTLLSARGSVTLLFPALYLSVCLGTHSLWLGVLLGATMPLCYLIGFTIPEKKGIVSHSQYGEILYGIFISAGVILW